MAGPGPGPTLSHYGRVVSEETVLALSVSSVIFCITVPGMSSIFMPAVAVLCFLLGFAFIPK